MINCERQLIKNFFTKRFVPHSGTKVHVTCSKGYISINSVNSEQKPYHHINTSYTTQKNSNELNWASIFEFGSSQQMCSTPRDVNLS